MSEDTIKLGLMPPLSGLVGIYGTEISRAAQIACQDVNENGGVLGRRLELIIEDDGSLPETAVAAAEKLVDEHHCAAMIGNLLSNSRIAVAYRVAEPRKVPLLNFSFYEGSILSRYFFHFAALPNQQIDLMIPYMKEKFGSRMFFAGNNYEWPRGSIHAGKRILEQIGGKVVGEEYCPIGVGIDDIEKLLDHVEEVGPDVFVPYFAGIDQVNLLTRFTERGLKNKMAVVMGHYDEMMASQLSPGVREDFYSSNTYFMTVNTKENSNYLQRLKNYPGIDGVWPKGNGILTNFGEGTYACVKAFAKAANQAGSIDSDALVESLNNITVSSPQGLLQMNSEHQHATVNTYLSRCQTNGEFKIIKNFGSIEPLLPERYKHQQINEQATMEDDIRLQARMLEQMSEAIFLVSSEEGSILYSNAAAERMYGYAKGKMENISITRLYNQSMGMLDTILSDFKHTLNQTGEWKGEVSNLTRDGLPLWCSVTASIFTHPVYGEVWLITHRDITERKSAEEEKKITEARLENLLTASPVTIYTCEITPPYAATYISPNIKEFMGFEVEQFTQNPEFWASRIHPEDSQRVFDDLPKLFEGGAHRHEYRFKMNDGSYHWMLDELRLTYGEDGKPCEIIGNWIVISDRKIVEEALAESEEKLRLIHSRVPGVLYQFKVDAKGNRTLPYVSPTIENYLGITSECVMEDAEKWFDLTHPSDYPGLEASIVESMKKMTTWDWTGRFVRDDGEVRWLHGTSTPEKLEDGSVLWNGVFIDISEQKKIELEIEKNEARFAAMFESIPDAIIYADAERNIQMVNSAAVELFGYSHKELKGNPTSMIYATQEDFKEQGKQRYNPESSVKTAPYQIAYKRKDGLEFKGETLGTPVKSSTGDILGYLGIIRDVSERIQVEAILKSLAAGTSALQFESFIDDALERLTDVYQCEYAFIGKMMPDGKHMEVLKVRSKNESANNFDYFVDGRQCSEYLLDGTPCKDVIDNKGFLQLHDVLARYPEDNMLAELSVDSYFGAPLHASDGSTIGILAVMDTQPMVLDEWTEPVLDVFATRAAMELERDVVNQELSNHREHLEELVDERSVELMAAVKEAEQANASKSEFLSSMSHELRTPMNAILGFGQLLEMDSDELSDDQYNNVQEILEAGSHLLTLINEVLDLAKIESGNLKIEIENVQLTEPLSQSLKLIKSQATANNLTIVNNIPSNDYIIKADVMRFKQVLLNLLTNAVKYNTVQGSIILDSEIMDNQRLRISVTDTGKGLNKIEINKLFTAFERLDAVDNVEGTGIGLVISKHLIELMDGSIGIKSIVGQGSTFWIELPLVIKN